MRGKPAPDRGNGKVYGWKQKRTEDRAISFERRPPVRLAPGTGRIFRIFRNGRAVRRQFGWLPRVLVRSACHIVQMAPVREIMHAALEGLAAVTVLGIAAWIVSHRVSRELSGTSPLRPSHRVRLGDLALARLRNQLSEPALGSGLLLGGGPPFLQRIDDVLASFRAEPAFAGRFCTGRLGRLFRTAVLPVVGRPALLLGGGHASAGGCAQHSRLACRSRAISAGGRPFTSQAPLDLFHLGDDPGVLFLITD